MKQKQNSTKKGKAGIYLETKPVVDTFKNINKYFLPNPLENSHHAYLRYVTSEGQELIIRGGPKNNNQLNALGTGSIHMQSNIPFSDSYDYYNRGTEANKRFSHKLDIDEKNLDQVWNKMLKISDEITNEQFPYDNLPQQQNSNSVIRTILDETNFDGLQQIPHQLLKHLPGYDKNLFSYPRISKEIKEDPNPELMRAWDSIMKGGNDEKDDIERDAAKEKSPEKSYYDRYKELEDPIEDLLYKKPEDLTQEEVNQAHKRSFESKDPAEQQRYDKIVSEYYHTNYSNSPQRQDETGKGLEPRATRRIPEQSSPLLSSSGCPVDEEIRLMSERLSQIDSNPFHDSGIRGLQRGLNKAGAFPQLKEDGKLEPKTISAWKRAAAENPAKLNQALGTGSMENLITKNRGTTFSPQDLDNSACLAWGDDGGRTLQRSLNQAGNVKEGYEPLKEDNVIGEKTTSAFNSLKEEDEDGLLASLDKTVI